MGIPGVGKTTLVTRLGEMLKGSKVVTFGTLMLDQGVRLKWIKHRDQLRELPVEKQRRLQTVTATAISRMKEETVLVDTHLFIKTNEGYWPGLPFPVVRAMKPTHLVLVEATPEEIMERRATDRGRYRDEASRDALLKEMSLAREFLVVSSTLTGAPMTIVSNGGGRVGQVAGGLAKMISGARG